MEIPNNIYLALQRMTEDDCSRLKSGMPKNQKQMMEEAQEQTGKHKSDYEAEMPFASNYGIEDWLEP